MQALPKFCPTEDAMPQPRPTAPPPGKYAPYPRVDLIEREWPSRQLHHAPTWCSVDLRDGNQALERPMGVDSKLRLFEELVSRGFRQIEVAYPTSSAIEMDFVRQLIDQGRIPDDVTIGVLVPARSEHIARAMQALQGVRRAIFHLYNSTSTVQRDLVFRKNRQEVKQLAIESTRLVRSAVDRHAPGEVVFEYTPESFPGTELDYALEVCEAVAGVWQPDEDRPMIINLPTTVEMAMPNVFADQVEWFGRNFSRRGSIILSVHPHNDRGTAVATAELAILAGADRVEGTLFGNGERTGNVDLVTLALNCFTQGVDPGIDVSRIDDLVRVYEGCTGMLVPRRHPYAGDLVYSAFSGSHQDAIRKGMMARRSDGPWQVPYLPLDPQDVGRTYEAIVRINAQSGKGGIAFVLEREYGVHLPKFGQEAVRDVVQLVADERRSELTPDDLFAILNQEFLARPCAISLVDGSVSVRESAGSTHLSFTVIDQGRKHTIVEQGNGPVDAAIKGICRHYHWNWRVVDFAERAVSVGSDAIGIASVLMTDGIATAVGIARHTSTLDAAIWAMLCAIDRAR
jgi:2-isopropylmalate synthase